MVGIQIGKEQEERKREEEGLNFETTPWWNFVTIMGYADEELRSASLSSLSNCGLNPRRRRRRRRRMARSGRGSRNPHKDKSEGSGPSAAT